jgi:ribosomal protein S18 acetylase RimI-like enzyme
MKLQDFLVCDYADYSPRKKKLRKKQLVDFYNENFPLSRWSEEYFSRFLDDEKRRKMECFTIERNNKVAGFILGRKVGNIRSRYNLTTLLMDRKYRGKGYSKLLMEKFLKIVRENKSSRKVYLHFRDSNNFERFYKHCGFGGHRISGTYTNGEKKHYMEIVL